MGFATSVAQLFFLRLFMGIFTGFIPMSQAFIAIQTPKEIAGRTLGTLQTGSVTGSLLGPLLGGLIADSVGYSATFKLISISLFLSALLVWFGIKELQLNIKTAGEKTNYSSKEVIQHILLHPTLLIVMLLSAVVINRSLQHPANLVALCRRNKRCEKHRLLGRARLFRHRTRKFVFRKTLGHIR